MRLVKIPSAKKINCSEDVTPKINALLVSQQLAVSGVKSGLACKA
jgi:hypothetical protein